MVPLDLIQVPRERVTSVWDPSLETEFMDSVKSKGILEDTALLLINGSLWLTDGLHRIQAAETLGMKEIPAKIKKGSLEDLVIENIIRARQRGRSNPAQEADVLNLLCNRRGFPLENAARQMGMSLSWAKKLMKIARLPEQVKDQLKHGKIPITGAFYIADLPKTQDQLSVARDAEYYRYNAHQIKARVGAILNPDVDPNPGDYTFNHKGKPQKVPIRCRCCAEELPSTGAPYIWICKRCEKLAVESIQYYLKTYQKPARVQIPPTRTTDSLETIETPTLTRPTHEGPV